MRYFLIGLVLLFIVMTLGGLSATGGKVEGEWVLGFLGMAAFGFAVWLLGCLSSKGMGAVHRLVEGQPTPVQKVKPVKEKTRAEISREAMARAEAKYQETLEMLNHSQLDEIELNAARERAKQQYLQDLDGVLK